MPGKEVVGESDRQGVRTLKAVDDEYGGVIVEMAEQPMDAAVFGSVLRASISRWRQQGKKGVWIKVPIEQASLIEAAVKQGFWYHHAEPTYLMIVYWIPQGPHTLPANASHQVSIAAFLMNERGELLVVQEKIGFFHRTGVWKLPTGVIEEGEDIFAAAMREVKEETGVDSEFVEVLAFRQSHKSFFEKSVLSFVCMLRPLSFKIQIQESEIQAAKWMPFAEYVAQPFVQKHEKYIADVCLAKANGEYSGFYPVQKTSKLFGRKSCLYLNRWSLNWK